MQKSSDESYGGLMCNEDVSIPTRGCDTIIAVITATTFLYFIRRKE